MRSTLVKQTPERRKRKKEGELIWGIGTQGKEEGKSKIQFSRAKKGKTWHVIYLVGKGEEGKE